MTKHAEGDALAQAIWRLKAAPVRLASRLAPAFMVRGARSATNVHLGCGSNILPGWANLDVDGPRGVTRFDLTRPLPFASSSLDLVYTEHFIEHVTKVQALALLSECARVLRPGGVLRISTPDLAKIVQEYSASRTTEWADMGWAPASPADLVNEGLRLWGHLYVWDEFELGQALRGAGFAKVERVAWQQSRHRALRGLETRPDHGDLIVDATR